MARHAPPKINPHQNPFDRFDFDPRRWQSECRQQALEAIHEGSSGIVSAVMGAGKSAVIGELCASLKLSTDSIVVVTTPTIRLVEQLYETISQCVGEHVGCYYTNEKTIAPVTIACVDSVPTLADEMRDQATHCGLWVADEAHKTECDTILETYHHLDPAAQIGFTATPFRADDKEELSLWSNLIYEYDHRRGIADGVVVPPKVRHYDGDKEMLDEVCIEMIKRTLAEGYGPGMVNALTIEESAHLNATGAEGFAAKLRGAGVKAEAVHSQNTEVKNEQRLADLQTGIIDCVVHVNQLAEGADFPWMEWLCLRRPTSSRVRFCQEVGRVLRSHGNKTHGLVLDPLDLFETFGLTGDYEAVLQGDAYTPKTPAEEAAEELVEVIEEMKQNPDQYDTPEGRIAATLGIARSWVRRTKMALSSCGYIDEKIKSTHWRDDGPTKSQLQTFRYIWTGIEHRLPKHHQLPAITARRIAKNNAWTKGDISDLIGIGKAVNRHGWPDEIEQLVN